MHPQSTQLPPPLETEEWRPVPEWEGWYDVSSLGRVRRIRPCNRSYRGRILKARPNLQGYPMVWLSRHGQGMQTSVHRLVAAAFLGPCPNGCRTHHRDGNKQNNLIENLEWVTASINTRHAWASGLIRYRPFPQRRGEDRPNAKLTEANVRAIRAAKGRITSRKLADQFGVAHCTIVAIQGRRKWKHIV